MAARRNLAGLCRWLLRLGANVNRTDVLDRTPLHFAVQNNAEGTVRLLIEHGAEIHIKDWQGRTPLDLAQSEDGLTEMIHEKISLRHGQRVKAMKTLRNEK